MTKKYKLLAAYTLFLREGGVKDPGKLLPGVHFYTGDDLDLTSPFSMLLQRFFSVVHVPHSLHCVLFGQITLILVIIIANLDEIKTRL